jgi:hypothetical protein
LFIKDPSPRTTIGAALSNWHLHDWVWHDVAATSMVKGRSQSEFQREITARCPQLGWLRDVADAGKHRGLNRQTLSVAGAEPRRVAGGGGLIFLWNGPFQYFLVLNDGSLQEVGGVMKAAAEFWRGELPQLDLPSPFKDS